MSEHEKLMKRRDFLKVSAAAGLGAGLQLSPWQSAFAADEKFPAHNMNVVVASNQGALIDRVGHAFSDIWANHLGAKFEYSFYPGAAGQVGYEIYMGKRAHDGYNLLVGNMGSEILMYLLQKPNYKYPQDYIYFCRVSVDDSCLFVAKNSKFSSMKELVDLAKKQTVTVATSRLPHPAVIGMLVLAEATGAKFNLVPYGGGNPTMSAVITGEVDCGVLPISVPLAVGDQARVLGVFSNENVLSKQAGGAPSVNSVFGTKIPDLPSSVAWAIHTDALKKFPDRFAKLNETAKAIFKDPAFKERYVKTGAPWEGIQYGDEKVCLAYTENMLALGEKYRSFISASRGGKGQGGKGQGGKK